MTHTPGWFMWTIAEMRSAVPSHRTGHIGLCRDGIAIEGDDPEDVTRKREAADLACAPIQDVKQHALTLLNADRLAVSQHLPVDREKLVTDFEALGLFLRFFVGSPRRSLGVP